MVNRRLRTTRLISACFLNGKLPSPIAFDHAKIIDDFFAAKKAGAEIK